MIKTDSFFISDVLINALLTTVILRCKRMCIFNFEILTDSTEEYADIELTTVSNYTSTEGSASPETNTFSVDVRNL